MALLDVTDIVLDPDFMDIGLMCERIAQTVNADGMAVNSTTSLPFAAVVTNDTGDVLDRLAAGERIKGRITLHTQFRLQDGTTGLTADVVRWHGRRYTVSNVSDWSHFGRGFVAASCDLIPLSG